MKLFFNAALVFSFFSFAGFVRANERDQYCEIVDFAAGLIDLTILTSPVYTDKCDAWKKDKKELLLLMPFRAMYSKSESTDFIYLSHSKDKAPGSLPEFIRFDNRKKKFFIDYNRMNYLLDSAPRYQISAGSMLAEGGSVSMTISCRATQRRHDGFNACRVFYENKKVKKSWVEGYYSYYSTRGISATYRSSLIPSDSLDDISSLKKLDIIFGSMRIHAD